MESDNAGLIHILEQALNLSIINIIYAGETLPDTYEKYKTKALKVGRMQERLDNLRRNPSSTPAPRPAPPPSNKAPTPTPSARPSYAPPSHSPSYRTGSGTTYGGQGARMDIDALRKTVNCFNCNELGHFSKDCKKPKKFNVCALDLQLTYEDRRDLYWLWEETPGDAHDGETPSHPIVIEEEDEDEAEGLEKDFL
jgi:hypothetical protein